jgi:hypothetical protein
MDTKAMLRWHRPIASFTLDAAFTIKKHFDRIIEEADGKQDSTRCESDNQPTIATETDWMQHDFKEHRPSLFRHIRVLHSEWHDNWTDEKI